MNSLLLSLKRLRALFYARNLEFFRDTSSLSWNLAFPLLILIGFYFIFDGDDKAQYKVGVIGQIPEIITSENVHNGEPFFQLRYIEFVEYSDEANAVEKVRQHKIDLLLDPIAKTYWLNDTSPKGYFVEQLLVGGWDDYQRNTITGKEIRYIDWVLPGILGMNMMFSCLFGVGYVIVRYRKASVLKRLKATPLRPIEFILAQIFSRLFIVLFMSGFVFIVCNWMFDFYMLGSYLHLLIVAFLGGLCMVSLGLLVASRIRSEELAGGMLNLVTWPMMILSGVWFSMEGAPQWLQNIAMIFPLSHLVDSARSIMTEGADLWQLRYSLVTMLVMTLVFLILSAILFRWEGDGR